MATTAPGAKEKSVPTVLKEKLVPTSKKTAELINFAKHLPHQWGLIRDQVQAGLRAVKRVASYLESICRATEQHNAALLRLTQLEQMRMKRYQADGMADFVTLCQSVHEHQMELASQQLSLVQEVRTQVSEPLAAFHKAAFQHFQMLLNQEYIVSKNLNKVRVLMHEGRAECMTLFEQLRALPPKSPDVESFEEKAHKAFTKHEFLLESGNAALRSYHEVELPRLLKELQDLERRRLLQLDVRLKAFATLCQANIKPQELVTATLVKRTQGVRGSRSMKRWVREAVSAHGTPAPVQPFVFDLPCSPNDLLQGAWRQVLIKQQVQQLQTRDSDATEGASSPTHRGSMAAFASLFRGKAKPAKIEDKDSKTASTSPVADAAAAATAAAGAKSKAALELEEEAKWERECEVVEVVRARRNVVASDPALMSFDKGDTIVISRQAAPTAVAVVPEAKKAPTPAAAVAPSGSTPETRQLDRGDSLTTLLSTTRSRHAAPGDTTEQQVTFHRDSSSTAPASASDPGDSKSTTAAPAPQPATHLRPLPPAPSNASALTAALQSFQPSLAELERKGSIRIMLQQSTRENAPSTDGKWALGRRLDYAGCPESELRLNRKDVLPEDINEGLELCVMLQLPLGINFLMRQLKKEYSTENLEFWLAVRDFRKQVELGIARMAETAGERLTPSGASFGAGDSSPPTPTALLSGSPNVVGSGSGTVKGARSASIESVEQGGLVRGGSTASLQARKQHPVVGEILEAAKAIAKRFVGGEAAQQVNLRASNEAPILETLEAIEDGEEFGDLATFGAIFTPAAVEILHLLEKDSFMRFKRTDEFKRFIASYNRAVAKAAAGRA